MGRGDAVGVGWSGHLTQLGHDFAGAVEPRAHELQRGVLGELKSAEERSRQHRTRVGRVGGLVLRFDQDAIPTELCQVAS